METPKKPAELKKAVKIDLKRAAAASVLLYALSSISGLAIWELLFLAGVSEWVVILQLASMVLYGAIAAGVAYFYFLKRKADAGSGLQLGIMFVAVSFLIDVPVALFVIPLFQGTSYETGALIYYLTVYFWMLVAIIVGSATAVGWWLGRKPKRRK